jgi:hypothetical protein
MRTNEDATLPLRDMKEARKMTNFSSPARQALGIGIEEFDYAARFPL